MGWLWEKNKIKIVGDIEVFHQELKSLGIRKKIIAVTGTNGKSTFVSVLNEILQKSGLKSCIAGNIGIPVLSLNADEFDIVILELSSFHLEKQHQRQVPFFLFVLKFLN